MTNPSYSRQINFEAVSNFRDLGGYRTHDGHTVAWRRIFRSGELHHMTRNDIKFLKDKIRINSVIDLRNYNRENIGPLDEMGVKYFNIPLIIFPNLIENSPEKDLFWSFSNSGQVYLYRTRQKDYLQQLVKALDIIAESENHPLVFHCNAGKDRSGMLAAMVLSILGVANEDIIEDYAMTEPYIEEFIDRWNNDPKTAYVHKNLPKYQWHAFPESMALFLTEIQREFGSVRRYLETQGVNASLFDRLEKALLI